MQSERKISSIKEVRGILLLNGLTLKGFADLHGFAKGTVDNVIRRHWGRPSKPWGEKTKEILSALKRYERQAHQTGKEA
jgi:hypothetical protein